MKTNLHNRLSAVEKRKQEKRINELNIVYVGCRCGRDYPEQFTTVPTPELNDPEQESRPPNCARIYYHKEVPIDSVKKCVDPENAYDQKCTFGLPLE